tara:strand:+ start:3093 stop:4157 length:1065 start_codon:yes stop_codon:yes gene_type:complete
MFCPKQTKKKKKSKRSLKKLWNTFESVENKEKKLELLYKSQHLRQRERCDLCNSAVAYTQQKLLTCTNTSCAVVYKDVLDETAEWRYYGADDNSMSDPTRCGMPINPLLKESSYGCKVICGGRSSYEMRKIRRYTEWQSMPYKEKSQYDEFETIKLMSKNAGIPKIIVDEALRQHKKLSEEKTFRGDNRDGIIAASIYIAARIHKYPRTAKEIASIFHLDNTSATKGCKNAVNLLNKMEKDDVSSDKTHFYKTTPTAFIERYCSKLGLNKELTKVCLFVAHKISQKNLIPENTPHSVAAGIVYFVAQTCNLNVSKKNVNKCSEISEVTINKCYKKLDKIKEDLIPQIILKKYAH